MNKTILSVLLFFIGVAANVRADEGMWLLPYLQKLNMKTMKSEGLKLSADEIYRINGLALKDAVVIFGGGCTGEVVSDRGLVLTNHHCGYDAIQSHSSVEHDYLEHGFWAMSDREELPNPGLSVTFIRQIRDVTDRILPRLNDTMSEESRNQRIVELSSEIIGHVNDTLKSKHPQAEVVVENFFGGNQFLLFIKEIYRDVRLVGTPPSSIGKFGGDTDNWMWPRHTGDFSVFRIYAKPDGSPAEYSAENVPYRAPVHLAISLKGYRPGDFSMIIGFPGSTDRYKTTREIQYTLSTSNPIRIAIRGERQRLMMEDMLSNDTIRIQYASKYSNSSNYWKNSIGESRGLKKQHVEQRKAQLEQQFTQWVEADPARKAKYGQALPLIRSYVDRSEPLIGRLQRVSETVMRSIEIASAARRASTLLKDDSLSAIDTSKLSGVRKASEMFYKDYSPSTDRKIAKRMLSMLIEGIAPDSLPDVLKSISTRFGGSVDRYVDDLFDRSIFASKMRFDAFLDHSEAERLINDPAYMFQTSIDNYYNALYERIMALYFSYMHGHRLYIAGLMEMQPDRQFYPDANFTMRLTFGQVLPYSPQDGVFYDYYTTLGGVIAKEDPENAYEFSVPDKLKQLYETKDFGPYGVKGIMPVCFLTNNDITGGNSGSPVLNARGQLIGLAFDGNWEAMSGGTSFEKELQRTIAVDIRYVLFIIDKYAGCERLIHEMTLNS